MTAKTHQYIFRFYELTAKKRMLCKMVAEVQSINDSATKGACCELSSLLESICQNYNEQKHTTIEAQLTMLQFHCYLNLVIFVVAKN